MKEFFANMETVESVYWYIAIGASLVFIILTILSFVGGGDVDFDTDADLGEMESPSHMLSFRNIINFILGFGWSGVAFYHSIPNHLLLGLLSVAVGLLLVFIFIFISRAFMKLAENNSFDISDTVGKTANVYLRIPGNKAGKGKIQISVKGSVHELDAITTDESLIESGKNVTVKGVEGTSVIVSSIK